MKIAIMADIHGNKDALQAVLTDINNRGIQSIYYLGDSLY
ncbi:YfcE family phosphodiesterase, partial [Bacillus thuringiensis]